MSGGGGGGGGNDDYRQQQAEIEAKKQAARDALNLQFGIGEGDAAKANQTARDALYGTVRQNAFDAGKRKLDESQQQAKRNLKFELFAKGLDGGSVDVDQNALLDRTYNQGVLDLGAKADSVKNDLKSSDEATRLGLLQSIDSGMDQGSALSSAIQQMKNANDRAGAEAAGTAVGDVFEGAGLLYGDSMRRKGQQAAQNYWQNLFNSPQPRAASSGASGVITSTGR